MFCTENKQTKGGSRTPRSSMMESFRIDNAAPA